MNGILNKLRSAEAGLAILAIPLYPANALEYMVNVDAVVLHRATAS